MSMLHPILQLLSHVLLSAIIYKLKMSVFFKLFISEHYVKLKDE